MFSGDLAASGTRGQARAARRPTRSPGIKRDGRWTRITAELMAGPGAARRCLWLSCGGTAIVCAPVQRPPETAAQHRSLAPAGCRLTAAADMVIWWPSCRRLTRCEETTAGPRLDRGQTTDGGARTLSGPRRTARERARWPGLGDAHEFRGRSLSEARGQLMARSGRRRPPELPGRAAARNEKIGPGRPSSGSGGPAGAAASSWHGTAPELVSPVSQAGRQCFHSETPGERGSGGEQATARGERRRG